MRLVVFTFFISLSVHVIGSTQYLDLVSKIEHSNITEAELNSWRHNLLFPHLKEQWFSKNIEKLNQKSVDQFLLLPENKAAAWFFKPKWQQELIRRKNWPAINNQFRNHQSANSKCWFFESQKALKQPINKEQIQKLWMTGKSQPGHCDPFFKVWLDSLSNPDPLIWKRQLNAFYSRNGKLLTYLNRFYQSKEMKSNGQFLAAVYNEPKSIISKAYNPKLELHIELALAAVNRMAFKDPRSASNLWLQIKQKSPEMSNQQVSQASRYLGIAMAKQAFPEAYYWLSLADPTNQDKEVQHWRLQIVLSDQDYFGVLDLFNNAHHSLKVDPKWLYWSGLARLKTEGQLATDNPLISLSQKRLYYGYLAAGIIGVQPTLNAKPNYKPVSVYSLRNRPELVRARALYEAGDTLRAQVEWNLYVRGLDNDTQHAAAELALSWGWYAKASQSAGWSGRYDLIHLRYPDAYKEFVDPQIKRLNLPVYWVYGVMRQESRYEHTAISPAGAHGLMQIMPRTAKVTAKKYGVPYSKSTDLHTPETNINIGTHYLRELIDQFSNPIYATAAYNAGPSRVKTWRKRFPNELTIWIESIPFTETRNYVKSVLAYSQIYALHQNIDWKMTYWIEPEPLLANIK